MVVLVGPWSKRGLNVVKTWSKFWSSKIEHPCNVKTHPHPGGTNRVNCGPFPGVFVTFCVTFPGLGVEAFVEASPVFRIATELKPPFQWLLSGEGESNYLFYSPCFDVSQPPGFDRKSVRDVTEASHPPTRRTVTEKSR